MNVSSNDDPPTPASRSTGAELQVQGRAFVRNLVVVLTAVVVVILLAYLAAAFVPRWWSQRIGNQVDDRFSAGVLWGLFYGILFTLIPLLVAWQARRPMFGRTAKLVVIAIALALALPNLMTLGVVLGSGHGAHAGERIMDVRAPAFRQATLAGAITGGVIAIGWVGTLFSMRRRRAQVKQLRGQISARDQAARDRGPDTQEKG